MEDYKLVKANKNDCDLLYKWTNDEEVRKSSFNTNMVIYGDHVKWFLNKLSSGDTSIYIFKNKQEPLGVIRLEKIDEESLLINYSIDSKHRGKGYATNLLDIIKNELVNCTLIGKVKKDNVGSIKAFQKAGYFMKEEVEHLVFYSKNE